MADEIYYYRTFNKTKAVIVISHDKTFVDNLTNRTIEITMGRIYDYKAKYTHYLQLRRERREQQQKQFNDQAKEIFGHWKEPKPYLRIVPQPS